MDQLTQNIFVYYSSMNHCQVEFPTYSQESVAYCDFNVRLFVINLKSRVHGKST